MTASVNHEEADCELSGTGAVGGVERGSATAGAHHETGQLAPAFPAGGSGPSHGAQRPGVAREVFPPGDAAGTEDHQGGHAETRGPVLDVAQGMGLRAVEKDRFRTRDSPEIAMVCSRIPSN